GKVNLDEAIESLIQRKKIVVVSTSSMASFLTTYFQFFYHKKFRFSLIKPIEASNPSEKLYFYRIEKLD
ncbi:MAG: hypothetical protein M3Q05_01080, partial [Bacteroidota bacterium]|nr:hypothetical protein [Bacteroidota bacterium]